MPTGDRVYSLNTNELDRGPTLTIAEARCQAVGLSRGKLLSKRWGRVLATLVEGISSVQKPWRRTATRLVTAQLLAQRVSVPTRHGELVFVATDPAEFHFLRDFDRREPETLAWIDGFATPCRLWDIGANIGSYALYAGQRNGVQVAAFEPAAANFLSLCRNINLNGLCDRVRAYCLAFSDDTTLGELNLSQAAAGGVFNVFNGVETCFGDSINITARQGTMGFSIDSFRRVFAVPAPHYLKIDVDSVEEQILAGARATLADPELRSVLIEMEENDTPRNERLNAALREAGLELAERSSGGRGGTVNTIFVRSSGPVKAVLAATGD